MDHDNKENRPDRSTPRLPWYRRQRVTLAAVIVVAGLFLWLLYWAVYKRGVISTDDAVIEGNRSTISAEEPGRIVVMTADEGSAVTRGDPLVQLDSSVLKAQERQAEAMVALDSSAAIRARLAMGVSGDDFRRVAFQFKNKVISTQEYEHARKAYGVAKAEYAMAVAQTASGRAALNTVRARLDKMSIHAPRTGVVAKRWALTGDVVQPGQSILTMYEDTVWVTMYLQETSFGDIKIGDPVRIMVDAYHGRDFQGKIILLGSAAASLFSLLPPNNASGNFTKVTQRIACRCSIRPVYYDDTALRLLPGMSVEVRIRRGS